MQKEKQVKSYMRKTKSGKVVSVKAHTAKYEASDAEKAKNRISKRKGAGKELEDNPYRATAGLNVKDFKDWYNFNDWEAPQSSWPESVRIADNHIKKQLGSKEAYDKYCDKIDKGWSEGGYVKYHSAYRVNPRPELPSRAVMIQTSEDKPAKKTPRKSNTIRRKKKQ